MTWTPRTLGERLAEEQEMARTPIRVEGDLLAPRCSKCGDRNCACRQRKPRHKLICLECQKKFQTTNDGPECPRCGSVDIEPRDD